MKKQKLVAALMSIALGTSTVFSTVAFAEETVLTDSGVEIGTTENSEVVLPKEIDWKNNADKTVYYNGEYYETLKEALIAAYKDTTTATKEIYCKPNANVGTMTHENISGDLTIYRNGASVTGGEHDLNIDNGVPSNKNITITVKDLNGIAAWRGRSTGHTINLIFENCKNMHKIMIRGNVTESTGAVNITVKDCSFDSDKGSLLSNSIHSVYNGDIKVINTEFNKIDVGINVNNNSKKAQTIEVTNCKFFDCGQGIDTKTDKNIKTYSAPIRIVAQEGTTSNLTVKDATFTYNEGVKSCNGDILLGEGRSGKPSGGTTILNMTGTKANVMSQEPGYHKGDGTVDSSKFETKEFESTDTVKLTEKNGKFVNPNPPVYPIYPPTPSEPTKTEIIGDDRYETSAKIADKMGYYDTAILVNGDKSLSDGLSASSLAGKEKAPILLVKQNIIPKETLTRALKAKKIYIIGGTAAISEDVEKQLAGKEIVRVDGKNRVETSEKVAKLVGNYDEAFIVNGNTGEADAISVSSVAAKNQAPILLTNGKTSTHSKKTGVEYYVVGGDAVVSDSIVSEFDAACSNIIN